MSEHPQSAGLYTDRYELAMAVAYWRDGRAEETAIFDYFFRKLPFGGGYAVFAGLATLLELLPRFRFDETQLAFLEKDGFPSEFLDPLRNFAFRGSIWAAPEGELVFPLEPVVRIEGGLMEAQIIETLLLNILNFQTLIATKAARCRHAAGDRHLSEFGLRRAQGMGGLWASRAACLGGFDSTSNLEAAHLYGIPAAGTMAHSYVQSHDRELDAFRSFAAAHGSATVLLLDTYDTLRSGLPNAVRVARELAERGQSLAGVRLDSGDLAYLSKRVRQQLDQAGLREVKIVASNQLDEHVIRSLLQQGAPIDIFGVGTALATGAPDGALDGVYKLAFADGQPRLKLSETLAKSTLPDRKQIARFRDADGAFVADAIHLDAESAPQLMVHPFEQDKRLDLSGYASESLLRLAMQNGRSIGPGPSLYDSANYARERLGSLPAEHKRFENPHVYKVGLSKSLAALRDEHLTRKRKEIAP